MQPVSHATKMFNSLWCYIDSIDLYLDCGCILSMELKLCSCELVIDELKIFCNNIQADQYAEFSSIVIFCLLIFFCSVSSIDFEKFNIFEWFNQFWRSVSCMKNPFEMYGPLFITEFMNPQIGVTSTFICYDKYFLVGFCLRITFWVSYGYGSLNGWMSQSLTIIEFGWHDNIRFQQR